jgi:calcineurin-like phosphoesterase family protein
MKTYAWSDLHLNHANVIRYCNRPDADVKAMNTRLIGAWNSKVTNLDTVYFLGDFGFGDQPDNLSFVYHLLNGQKHLVIGNHDEKNRETMNLPWASKSHIKVVRHNGVKAVLCHYPIESWPSAHRGALHFHGHSHGSLKRKIAHRFDVGCDVFPAPVSFDELITLANAQEFDAVDHHEA